MGYKNQIVRNSTFVIVLLLYFNFIPAQNCVINKIDSVPFRVIQPGLIGKMYDAIRNSDSSKYHIMLIQSSIQMNKSEAYYISIDYHKKIRIIALTQDSILLSKNLNVAGRYDIDFILQSGMPSNYLISECKNVISSHKKSVLLFSDHSLNKWIEYTSLDGYMKEALDENNGYYFLKRLYDLVVIVFKDFNMYKE